MRQGRHLRDVIWWALRITNLTAMFVIAVCLGLVLGTYSGIAKIVPRARDLGGITPGSGSRVLSAEGELLGVVATENREFVPLEQIPKALQEAAVATEDRDFYGHIGISPRGIMRAALHDIIARGARQGGSTITQQLARNIFLSQERTITRKVAEAILALQLERAYTKPEILELYLNQIYLGEGAYGVQVAAKTYFGKDVNQLSVAECAMLVGLAKRPEYYSPFEDATRGRERRDLVLTKMREEGYLNEEQMARAKAEPLQLAKSRKPLGMAAYRAPYFTNYVLRQVAAQYGSDALYRGDLVIHTTLNLEMQEAAEEAVAWGLEQAQNRGHFDVHQLALVAVDTRTGAIKAMVGGVDYKKSQYNLAVQGGRQPGSAFKPFVYTAALLAGYTPDSIVNDSPVRYPNGRGGWWSPRNYDGKYWGPMKFKTALAHSRNVPAVKVAEMVGIASVIEVAKQLGIKHQMDPVLPTAIGCCDASPLEMAEAYAVFATRGMKTESYAIQKIVDARGRTLEEHTPYTWRALDEGVAAQMVDMLGDVIKYGTGAGTKAYFKLPAAGKTGTSSDYMDAWFVGFTDDLCAAVWAGNEPPRTMGRRAAGAAIPAPVWARFMAKAQPVMLAARAEKPREHVVEISPDEQPTPKTPEEMGQPSPGTGGEASTQEGGGQAGADNVVTKMICPSSGMLAGPYCPDPREVSYDLSAGSEPPSQTCDVHKAPSSGDREPGRQRQRAGGGQGEKVTLSVCAITGKLATPFCPIVVTRTFDAEAAPTETCTRHRR